MFFFSIHANETSKAKKLTQIKHPCLRSHMLPSFLFCTCICVQFTGFTLFLYEFSKVKWSNQKGPKPIGMVCSTCYNILIYMVGERVAGIQMATPHAPLVEFFI